MPYPMGLCPIRGVCGVEFVVTPRMWQNPGAVGIAHRNIPDRNNMIPKFNHHYQLKTQ
jgi:hypothetical protein